MISSLRFLAGRPVANLSTTQSPESGQLDAGRTRVDKQACSAAEAGVHQASPTSADCPANLDFPAPLPPSCSASGSTPPPPPGVRGPQLDRVDVFLIELTNAVAAMPWYFALAGLAAHLAFVTAGGGK